MNDAISRSAAIADLREWLYGSPDDEFQEGFDAALLGAIDRIENENINPALEVAPVVHARWTDDGECTRCGCTAEYTEYATERYDYDWNENLVPCGVEYHRSYHTTDFCPNCGARMDGEENG